uniref:Pyrin domain-containing protein n=1 Tax=Sparus aurata TaxID=8175 RepID=A0A671U068_SPAAU
MATPKKIIFTTLENLGDEDFQKFKWHLQGALEGFPAIPKCRLDKANREDTVDQMVQTYCINTIKVTRMVLGAINQNDLLEKLSNTISEPTGRSLKMESKNLYIMQPYST